MRTHCHIFAIKQANMLKQSVSGLYAPAPETAVNTGVFATYSG